MKAFSAVGSRRSTGPDEDLGPYGALLVVWIPPILLLVSWALGWIAAGQWLARREVLWSLVPTAAILALRAGLEALLRRGGPGGRWLQGAYLLHLVLVVAAILLNPLTCIYAFVGYLDAGRYLRGPAAATVVVLTALLSAVGQVGGVRVALAQPSYLAGLAVVNLLLAGAMTTLVRERERILGQREEAVLEVARVNRENAALHQRLLASARLAGVDEERARVSREIHDTVAQDLVGLIRQLEAMGEELDGSSRGRILTAEESARHCLLDARRAVEALGPHQLRDTPVVPALAEVVARWARIHGVPATFDGDTAPHEGRNGAVLVRILQESLANIGRHADAHQVHVLLTGTPVSHSLRIVDDGRGFERRTLAPGHGLANMAARAEGVGGDLWVASAPGQGCTVSATVPR